ncbi:TonB-dependent receptor [Pseudomonas citronellolis]|nr:TonB-dependent receptor [Pseudomonas citronellolis]MBH3432677.1 TonB-dependent receptor [Pseudomonas citronellolis]
MGGDAFADWLRWRGHGGNRIAAQTGNVNNLFDKKYLSALDTTFYGGYYGDPRNVMLTTQYRF